MTIINFTLEMSGVEDKQTLGSCPEVTHVHNFKFVISVHEEDYNEGLQNVCLDDCVLPEEWSLASLTKDILKDVAGFKPIKVTGYLEDMTGTFVEVYNEIRDSDTGSLVGTGDGLRNSDCCELHADC